MIYRYLAGLVATVALAVMLSVVGGSAISSASTTQGKVTNGGQATFAEQPGSPPTYIFPLFSGAESSNNNITYLQPLMWKPLYWFGHPNSSAATINYAYSIAKPPVYSDKDRTITIRLNHYMWSNGKPVTARDLVFWMHLLLAEKSNYANYQPNGFLDHVVSVSAPNPTTFVMRLNQTYNSTYSMYDQLSLLTPIPQQAWDKESASGRVGNYDNTPAGARKVYAYLNKASLSLSTWDTNPLWQVVDGPWRLKPKTGFQTTGQTIMVANRTYSGPDKPHLNQFEELPFTTGAAEFNALQSGTVDYGYVPTSDIAAIGSLKSNGFKVASWNEWAESFIGFNFSNPRYSPLFRQLYIRIAMQRLIDQPTYVKDVLKGYGTPTYGPVPLSPKTSFLSPAAAKAQYPYSVTAARHLLTSNGWTIPASGAATCTKPGSGAGECGSGIASGTALSMPLLFSTGNPGMQAEIQATQSAFEKAGIVLTLQAAPFNTVVADVFACIGKTTAQCPASSTALSIFASPTNSYVPSYYPASDNVFECGGPLNFANYCDPKVDAAIKKMVTSTSSSLKALYAYQLLVAKQLPVLWFPNSAYQISAINSKLRGVVGQDSTAHIYPQTWWITK